MSEQRTDIHKKQYIKILIERTKQNKAKHANIFKSKFYLHTALLKKKIFLALYDYVKKKISFCSISLNPELKLRKRKKYCVEKDLLVYRLVMSLYNENNEKEKTPKKQMNKIIKY